MKDKPNSEGKQIELINILSPEYIKLKQAKEYYKIGKQVCILTSIGVACMIGIGTYLYVSSCAPTAGVITLLSAGGLGIIPNITFEHLKEEKKKISELEEKLYK